MWVDYLSRPMVREGEVAELVDSGITGVTSNPATFHETITKGDAYDEQLVELAGMPEAKYTFLALATRATVAEADRLRTMVTLPNMFVKIPGTRQGIPAIEESVARGIPVNVTLLFSLDRHREAAEAYLRALGSAASFRQLFDAIGEKQRHLSSGRARVWPAGAPRP